MLIFNPFPGTFPLPGRKLKLAKPPLGSLGFAFAFQFFFPSGRQLEKKKLIETELPGTGGAGQLVEYLPSIHEALVSIHSTTEAQNSPGDSCLGP